MSRYYFIEKSFHWQKGVVIASTADANQNHLTTGTLQMENVENKAAYDVKNAGIAYHYYDLAREHDKHFNEMGLPPDLLPGSSREAHSVTRSAIFQGTIQVTNQALDVAAINRNTENSLNTLSKILDKKKIEERQQLARFFAKNADELLHYYDLDCL